MQYEDEDQDSTTLKWVVLFICLSVAAHVLLITVLIILSKHIPAPRLEAATKAPSVTMTLIEPPPKPVMPPAPKHVFMTTPEQKNAPHKETLVESNNDAQLASMSKQARKPDSFMPDVESKDNHPSALNSSPAAPPAKPQEATPPPAPKADPSKEPPKPPQPQQPPQPKAEPQKTPPEPSKVPPPPKPTPAPPSKVPPPPEVDPNGLPVLPALNAPTIAPQTTSSSQQSQQAQQAAPPPSMPVVPPNVQGRAGMSGQPSPEAMKTDLGVYKARFYQAVGSRWYQKVGQQMTLIGVGAVRVQYTIMPDGTITTKVLDNGGGSMTILLSLSVLSIRECSPFLPFPPSMLKDYPNGYTDDFSFSVY